MPQMVTANQQDRFVRCSATVVAAVKFNEVARPVLFLLLAALRK